MLSGCEMYEIGLEGMGMEWGCGSFYLVLVERGVRFTVGDLVTFEERVVRGVGLGRRLVS